MQVGRKATAARRRASRLAGLVRFPAGWQVDTAIRRQASWLAGLAVADALHPTPRMLGVGLLGEKSAGRGGTTALIEFPAARCPLFVYAAFLFSDNYFRIQIWPAESLML